MTIEEVTETLEQLASELDPIYIHGEHDHDTGTLTKVGVAGYHKGCPTEETTAQDLMYFLGEGCDVSKYRIGYHGANGYISNGTFDGMIRDRSGMQCNNGEDVEVNDSYNDIVNNLV